VGEKAGGAGEVMENVSQKALGRKRNMPKEKDWSAFAADFERRSAYVVGRADLDRIGEKLAEQEDLGNSLELGCGTGVYTGILADKSERVTATDISEDMVAAAAARLKERPEIVVEPADCFSLPYTDAAFDTVFMANLLHVVPQPRKVIEESQRVLKRGGRIIVASLTANGMRFFDKMRMGFRYLKTWGKPPVGGTILTVPKVAEMMGSCGFSRIDGVLIGQRAKSVFVVGWKPQRSDDSH
jgi:ubiquinone/menaquinone biosynthesis C-methylase UbiE